MTHRHPTVRRLARLLERSPADLIGQTLQHALEMLESTSSFADVDWQSFEPAALDASITAYHYPLLPILGQ